MKHTLEPILETDNTGLFEVQHKRGYSCTVCGQTWKAKSNGDCPGLPWYVSSWPDTLITQNSLERRGLKLAPEQQPVAVGTSRQLPLYDVQACLPLWAEGESHVIQRGEHLVELLGGESGIGERCTKCERRFVDGHAWGKCSGVKQYQWDPWPEGLYTARQIRAKGLKPGPVRGAIYYSKAADGWLWLYRLDEATAKPPKTEKQKAAAQRLAEANKIAWTCIECGKRTKRRIKGGGRCRECSERQWARDMLAMPDLRILDIETTGLDDDAEVIEIGVIDGQGNVLLDTYIKPTRPIVETTYEAWDDDEQNWHESPPLTAFGVNGITNAMVETAPTFPEIWEQLRPLIADKPIVAYNAEFDRRMLRQNRIRHGLRPIPWARHVEGRRWPVSNWQCAMLSFSCFYGEWHRRYRDYRYQSLATACSHFDVHVDRQAHGAVGDCLRTLEVLRAMAIPAGQHAQAADDK